MALPLADPGRPSETDKDNVSTSVGGAKRDADHLTARIARDRPDVLERMKAGVVPSVRLAALEAGIVRRTITIPLEPAAAARTHKLA
jgi:hypothetical protein